VKTKPGIRDGFKTCLCGFVWAVDDDHNFKIGKSLAQRGPHRAPNELAAVSCRNDNAYRWGEITPPITLMLQDASIISIVPDEDSCSPKRFNHSRFGYSSDAMAPYCLLTADHVKLR